jgi:hypothetical protein
LRVGKNGEIPLEKYLCSSLLMKEARDFWKNPFVLPFLQGICEEIP